MKNFIKIFVLAIPVCMLFSSCRENIEVPLSAPDTDETVLEATGCRGSDGYEVVCDLPDTMDSGGEDGMSSPAYDPGVSYDYPAVTLENVKAEDDTLYMTIANRTNDVYGYIYAIRLYKNGEFVEPEAPLGICGTPDELAPNSELQFSYPLSEAYGNSLGGFYRIEMDFSPYDTYFETDEVFTAWGEFSINISDFDVTYDVEYLGDREIEIIYKNNSNYQISYGLYYELYTQDGEKIPFTEGTAFIEIACIIMEGGESKLSLNLKEPYFNNLEPGEYIVRHELYGYDQKKLMEIPIIIE